MPAADNTDATAEHELIEKIKNWTGSKYIGDDCAVLPDGLLVTSDSLVEGTHFVIRWTSFTALGWKSCAVNLSDIAAMGGRPKYLTLALTVPDYIGKRELQELFSGFAECARTFQAEIIGGDLTKGPVLVLGITAIGEVNKQGCIMRSGAKAGDVVIATGDFGASAAGLWALGNGNKGTREQFKQCVRRHERPVPRLHEAWALASRCGARASLMDASDGLADALVQIARASAVQIEVDLSQIPILPETREAASAADTDVYEWSLYGGEDYELVGTIPPDIWAGWAEDANNPFKRIGSVTAGNNVTARAPNGNVLRLDLSKCFQQIGNI